MVPRAVLMKSGLVSINTDRQVNAARAMSYLSKTAHSTVKRPIHKNTTFKNSKINQRVNTVRGKNVNTARPKVVVNAVKGNSLNVVKGNSFNAIKASTCWVWKPKTKVLDHVSKHNSASITLKKFDYGIPQMDLQDQEVIDSGCSRHMTGNIISGLLSKPKLSQGSIVVHPELDWTEIMHNESILPDNTDGVPQPSGPTEHVADEAVYKELDDSLVRVAATASSLEAEQDSGNIAKTQSKVTPNESSSLGTTSGCGPRRQETIGDTIAQTRFENVSKLSNDPLLAKGNTLRSGEDSLKLNELMALCITLQTRVLALEKTKTSQDNEISSLKRRVKKLEKKNKSRTHKLKRLYKVGLTARVKSSRDEESLGEDASKQGRINAIDADEDITLVNDQDNANMFDVNTLTGEEELAEQEVATKM
ncbi:hypothetical protein Tco_0633197 [Tanacetum coccineum]